MDRRQFLKVALAGSGALGLHARETQTNPSPLTTPARIVIIGAGAAGTALANRLVKRLDGVQITLIDPRCEHLDQPGLTLVATSLKPAHYLQSQTARWLPNGIEWLPERVAAIDAERKAVATESGTTLEYDWLVVAPGLVLDHDAIDRFSLDMVGQNGIGAPYAGPDYATRTRKAAERFTQEGGTGLFTRPATEMKCAAHP
ncbi:FAD-dependent oxidoreductase [Roseobacter sinensis]|uniref:FAD-dependent oxidoreductase n=1 Tax=Roseobacter sinensis TaxID=2931391 RepID=A0ABT3B9C5_9RHOB|nr:FAD-dependent oxidoreductase [Roseobacter sp. WL0113]MCV3270166.1 FAD-dependent oxidoreductase [Roseobacter sp. WL0113]